MKKKQSSKAGKFLSLAEVLRHAMYSGEYKDPDNPRRVNPEFKKELDGMIEEIFAEEFNNIRMVADYEREILKRDAEILSLKLQRDLDRSFAEKIEKMETDIRAVFQKFAGEEAADEARKQTEKVLEEMRKLSADIAKDHEADFQEKRNARQQELEKNINSITGPFKPD